MDYLDRYEASQEILDRMEDEYPAPAPAPLTPAPPMPAPLPANWRVQAERERAARWIARVADQLKLNEKQ